MGSPRGLETEARIKTAYSNEINHLSWGGLRLLSSIYGG
jgi:hypothetical protein